MKREYENISIMEVIQEEDTMLDFIVHFFSKLIHNANTCSESSGKILYEVSYSAKEVNFSMLKEAFSSSEVRRQYLEEGIKEGDAFLYERREKV